MTTAAASVPSSQLSKPAHVQFTDNGRRARYGAAYVRALCAHAGAKFSENDPDEDIQAIDGTIDFARMPVRVQIKCTSGRKVGSGNYTLQLEQHWIDSWDLSDTPVFVIVVKVPRDIPGWLDHRESHTRHNTVAFGQRYIRAAGVMSMTFTAADKLTSESIYEWRDTAYGVADGLIS